MFAELWIAIMMWVSVMTGGDFYGVISDNCAVHEDASGYCYGVSFPAYDDFLPPIEVDEGKWI